MKLSKVKTLIPALKGDQGDPGTGFSIKGKVLGHYDSMASMRADIGSMAAGPYLVDGSSTQPTCMKAVYNGRDITTTNAAEGDAYLIYGTMHLWVASGINWTDLGPVQGPPGDSAITYYLTTSVPRIHADKDGNPLTPHGTVTVIQWKREGSNVAEPSSDLKLLAYTVKNGTRLRFGPSSGWGNSATFDESVASGEDSLVFELKDDDGNLVFSLEIPVECQAANPVFYNITPTVSAVTVNKYDEVTTGVIGVSVYKTENGVRESVPLKWTPSNTQGFWVQFCLNGGEWRNCAGIALTESNQTIYGVSQANVLQITSGIAFRLVYGTESSFSVVTETGALPVVRDGNDGPRGKTGRFYYFDGYYDETKEYEATGIQAPYVAYEWLDNIEINGVYQSVIKTNYYMLVADSNIKNGQHIEPRNVAAAEVWELMTTDFRYLIAEVIFTNFAKLGAAVFSGDWMISQHGTLDGQPSQNFQLFNPDDPTGQQPGNFVPNYAVDLMMGKAYLMDAYVRGYITATGGVIGGFEIGENYIGCVTGTGESITGLRLRRDGSLALGNTTVDKALLVRGGVNIIGQGKDIILNNTTGSLAEHGNLLIFGYTEVRAQNGVFKLTGIGKSVPAENVKEGKNGIVIKDDFGRLFVYDENTGKEKLIWKTDQSTVILDRTSRKVILVATGVVRVTLPANPIEGQEIWLKSQSAQRVYVSTGNSDHSILPADGGYFHSSNWQVYVFCDNCWWYGYTNS